MITFPGGGGATWGKIANFTPKKQEKLLAFLLGGGRTVDLGAVLLCVFPLMLRAWLNLHGSCASLKLNLITALTFLKPISKFQHSRYEVWTNLTMSLRRVSSMASSKRIWASLIPQDLINSQVSEKVFEAVNDIFRKLNRVRTATQERISTENEQCLIDFQKNQHSRLNCSYLRATTANLVSGSLAFCKTLFSMYSSELESSSKLILISSQPKPLNRHRCFRPTHSDRRRPIYYFDNLDFRFVRYFVVPIHFIRVHYVYNTHRYV